MSNNIVGGPDTAAAVEGLTGAAAAASTPKPPTAVAGSHRATPKASVVSLTFSTPDELKVYTLLATAAKDDDRSIASFIVRLLLGKEPLPEGMATATGEEE